MKQTEDFMTKNGLKNALNNQSADREVIFRR